MQTVPNRFLIGLLYWDFHNGLVFLPVLFQIKQGLQPRELSLVTNSILLLARPIQIGTAKKLAPIYKKP